MAVARRDRHAASLAGARHTPPLYVPPRRSPWTLDDATALAQHCADAHALGGADVTAAFRAIADHINPSGRRAEIRARMLGGDPLARKLGGEFETE